VNSPDQDPAFERLLRFLKHNRGFDFTGYKRASLMRRVRRRMQAVDMEDFETYQDFLEVHPDEFAYLFNTILINVTSFFRNAKAWDYLAEEVIPRIIAAHETRGKAKRQQPATDGADREAAYPELLPESDLIRVWSAGCAGGEEAYTLAILFAEALGVAACTQRVKIYATDVDEEALAQARGGGFSPEALESMPKPLRERYFQQSGGRYVFRSDLRRVLVFGRHDLTQDAPISRLDLLVCRNTLIYLNAETQRRVLARFHFALNEEGYLFLGKSEMLLTHPNHFEPVDLAHRIFVKVAKTTRRDRMVALTEVGDPGAAEELGNYVRLREAAFDTAPYAQIVVDETGTLALANEQARLRFGLDPRDVGRPFQDLELSYRPAELRGPIEEAQSERRALTLDDVRRDRPGEEEAQFLDIHVTPLRANGDEALGVSITFEDVTRYHQLREELRRSNQELETAYEEVQSTNEELETTNEELQSTVEELQTTNEELQASNDEMETINEELRTTNEELQTKNVELEQRTADLNQTKLFLESILASVDVGVVVIDRDFEILLWNEQAQNLWGLREPEVLGRSLLSLDIGLPVAELAEPVRALLADEGAETEPGTAPPEHEMSLEAVNRKGQVIEVQITNTLRRAPDGETEGVVLVIRKKEDREGPIDHG
jgi:two-component system CheB/CheR fusion protein